jgi:hypothetical protein
MKRNPANADKGVWTVIVDTVDAEVALGAAAAADTTVVDAVMAEVAVAAR